MKYYKVLENRDYYKHSGVISVIKGELITETERKKRGLPVSSNFMPVEIKKTDTFKFFGCRWEHHK